MRRVSRRIAVALVALILAAACILGLLEVGLRVAGWVSLRQRDVSTARGRVVLCLGDSWTYGSESGDPARLSYPAQLQKRIDREHGRGRFRVVNRGTPGVTPGKLLGELPELLHTFSPRAVVVMVGANLPDEEIFAEGGVSRQGLLQRLKVVRLLRMLRRQPRFRMSKELHQALPRIRQHLRRYLTSPPATEDERGTPPVPVDGCQGPREQTMWTMALVRGSPGPVRERLLLGKLEREPYCSAALVTAAELCIETRDYRCALRNAEQVLGRIKAEPHAELVRILVARHRAGRWSVALARELEQLVARFPRYLRARRLLLQAAIDADYDLCYLYKELAQIARLYPISARAREASPGVRGERAEHDSAWVTRSRATLDRVLGGNVDMWERARRRLSTHLAGIVAVCRRHRVPLLLLRYPSTDVARCQNVAADVVPRSGAPVMSLESLLGHHRGGKEQRYYAPGGHPNAEGYGRIAGAVHTRLREMGVLR